MTASVRESAHLLAASLDREQALARPALLVRGQLALEHLDAASDPSAAADRDPGDRLGGVVPEHDLALAVDGDDPVGDVREDRVAALPLDRDPLVELGVREHRGGVPGQCRQRLDLLLAPDARALRVDREHTLEPLLGPTRGTPRYAGVAGGQHGVVGQDARSSRASVNATGARVCTTSPAGRAVDGQPRAPSIEGALVPPTALTTSSSPSTI